MECHAVLNFYIIKKVEQVFFMLLTVLSSAFLPNRTSVLPLKEAPYSLREPLFSKQTVYLIKCLKELDLRIRSQMLRFHFFG